MSTAILVASWLATAGFSLLLSWHSAGQKLALAPLPVFTVSSLLFVNVGFLVLYLGTARHDWAATALLCSSFGLLAVNVGGWIGACALESRARAGSRPLLGLGVRVPYGVALVTALVVFATVLLYFWFVGYVPLVEALRDLVRDGLSGGLLNGYRVRRDVYINPDAAYIPMQGFLQAVRYSGLPIVAVWFADYCRRGMHRRLSLSAVLLSLLLITLSGQRWPLMGALAGLMVYLSWVESDARRLVGRLLWLLLASALAGIALSSLLGRAVQGSAGLLAGIAAGAGDLFDRVLLGNALVPFASYELFPARERWLLGASWVQNLLAYAPGPGPSYPVSFAQLVTGSTQGFTSPPDFYTEAYINFGVPGLVVLAPLWGAVLVGVRPPGVEARQYPLNTAVLSHVTTLLGFTAFTGVAFALSGLIVCAFVWGLVRLQVAWASRPARRLSPAPRWGGQRP